NITYRPRLARWALGGLTTTSTFVLEQPRCIFTEVQDSAVIWLVVAVRTPKRAFQGFPTNASAYMTLNTTRLNYPCPTVDPSGDITVLRVGSETSCAKDESRPTCNGPLPGPG
ncbi:PREDICTED: uroplakin-3b, partial [Tauraco erythrolophus]|uniref:uroplakin-3b n=1 Tax=Tauraco erythrolophus TaxID=121530 RepID=UPI0005235419